VQMACRGQRQLTGATVLVARRRTPQQVGPPEADPGTDTAIDLNDVIFLGVFLWVFSGSATLAYATCPLI